MAMHTPKGVKIYATSPRFLIHPVRGKLWIVDIVRAHNVLQARGIEGLGELSPSQALHVMDVLDPVLSVN